MAIVLGNRAKMSTSTTGTGTITLGSALSGYQTFAQAGITNGQTVRYTIEDGTDFEIGSGVFTSSGTTLTRNVTESSNSDNAINLSGSGEVFITASAADIFVNDGATSLTTTGVITGGTVEATSDTAAGDNAAMGYTAAEGLILTGQGSTSDITLKNDADAVVFTVPTGTDDILFPDDAKALFGAGSDLQIYHDGSNSLINEQGAGSLIIKATDLALRSSAGTNYLEATNGGAVSLYHNNAAKLATTATGIDVTGNVIASGTVEPAGDTAAGDNAAIGYTAAEGLILTGQGSTSDITLKNDADAVVFTVPTGSDDILFPDNAGIKFGAGADLHIYHNATHSYIDNNTGNIYIRSNVDDDDGGNIVLEAKAGENGIIIADDGDVSLHFNGNSKLATTNTGVAITGDVVATGTVEPAGDTAAGDNAAIGYTAAEGLILTGQGSTSDITLKNDADATVMSIPTGTTGATFAGDVTLSGTAPILRYTDTDNTITAQIGSGTSDFNIATTTAHNIDIRTNNTRRMVVESDGDISFYEDTGSTAKFFWDASTERLGIGTTSPAASLDVTGNVIATGTVEPAGDTAAGDNAAVGYTAAEGLILTGQGSTSDITFKNDADAVVFSIPTGTDDILFPDNAKAMFGAGSDLQIYHTGSHSYIIDGGSGNLYLQGSSNIRFQNPSNETMMNLADGGAVTLYHNNAAKLATTATGATVTGAVKPTTYQETYVAKSAASTVTCDLATGTSFSVTMNQNTTFAFTNPPSSGTAFSFTLFITQHSTAVTLTWPGTVDWAGGSAPDAAGNNEVQAYAFFTRDGGTTYYGFLGGTAIA